MARQCRVFDTEAWDEQLWAAVKRWPLADPLDEVGSEVPGEERVASIVQKSGTRGRGPLEAALVALLIFTVGRRVKR